MRVSSCGISLSFLPNQAFEGDGVDGSEGNVRGRGFVVWDFRIEGYDIPLEGGIIS